MKPNLSRIFGATALSTLSTVAFADGLDPTVLTEGEVIGQISRLATVSGSTASGAYSFAPEWSEELGFSATGAVGFTLQENSALGLIVTGGERKREVLLNFGLELDAERQVVLTAGQLQERLEFGTDANQEWVKQNEFGLAYETTNYAFSVYHVDSETTDNFVGAKSTGAELSGSVDVSDAMTVGFGAGYQTLDWDDGSVGVDGLTASLDLGYQANSTTRFNVFADRNMSENQIGLGGSWALGAGTLDASYTLIDGRVGAVTDDNRLAVTFTMPLGGKSTSEVSRNATPAISASASPTSTLLADVMRRPDYLPERVIVKANGGSACPFTLVDINGNPAENYFPFAPTNYDSMIYLLDPSGLLGELHENETHFVLREEYERRFFLGEYELNGSGSGVSTVTNVASLIAVSNPQNLVALPLVLNGFPECNTNPTSAFLAN